MNRLLVAIIVAIVLAFASVLLFQGAMAQVYWVGEFFLKALKMIIVPLVLFSMITGITGLGDVRKLGRLGGLTVLYYALTTGLAVCLGAVLVNLIRPGDGLEHVGLQVPERVAERGETGLSDLLLSFVSDNILASMARLEMLPIIVFALVFGAVLTTIDKGKPIIEFCEGGNEAMMKMVHLLMLIAPIGIFGLVAGRFGTAVEVAGMAGFVAQLRAVGAYMLTVVAGLALHSLVVLPVILRLTSRRLCLRHEHRAVHRVQHVLVGRHAAADA
jgi:Na+/H+-dicarboxylate symporter